MIFNPVYEKINALSVKKGETVQSVVENAFTLKSVGEVVKIDAKSRITSVDIADGYARAEGVVSYNVLYIDLQGALTCENFSASFNAKSPCEVKNGKVNAHSVAVDTGVSALSGEEVKIASVIETLFTFCDSESVVALSTSSEGFYVKDSHESYVERKCSDKAKTEYSLTEKTLLDDVVFARATCVINKRSAGVENVSVEGEVILEAIGTRNGEVSTHTIAMPFSESFECDGASYGDTVVADVEVTFCDGVVISESEGNKLDGVVRCEFDFAVYVEREFLSVTDVFSVKKQLLPTVKSHNVCEKISNFTILERADGNVKLGDNMPACDVILSANAFDVTINSIKSEEGSVKVEGVVSGRVIYSCASPDKTVSTYVVAPFSFSALVPLNGEEETIAKASVTAISCRVRRGNEIDIKADISVSVTAFKNKEIAVISEIVEGEDLVVPTSAFSVFVSEGGESLWEIASVLGVSPDSVVEQNPRLQFPTAKGERITVYRALDSRKI